MKFSPAVRTLALTVITKGVHAAMAKSDKIANQVRIAFHQNVDRKVYSEHEARLVKEQLFDLGIDVDQPVLQW